VRVDGAESIAIVAGEGDVPSRVDVPEDCEGVHIDPETGDVPCYARAGRKAMGSTSEADRVVLLAACLSLGCSAAGQASLTGGDGAASPDAATEQSGGAGSGGTGSGGTNAEPFPVLGGSGGESGRVARCTDTAPPDSFEPDLQWSWDGLDGLTNCTVTPLVANLTDDNGDGVIDLRDTPDIVVVVRNDTVFARIAVLDGATGALHFQFGDGVRGDVTPAIGDIDGDGLPDIVTVRRESDWRVGTLIAFEHDGSVKWARGSVVGVDPIHIDLMNVALADMDNDGDVEILIGNMLFDHLGTKLWTAPTPAPWWSATVAVDLDGDQDLEMVLGHAAYHHDGTEYFLRTDVTPGYPQVADMDGDGLPEIVITSPNGLTLLEHDGTPVYIDRQPFDASGGSQPWFRPAAIHDFDGDGTAEFASSQASFFSVFNADGSVVWSAQVDDVSGLASGTAFDFLGDGTAEGMYADEHDLFVFGEGGRVVYQGVRSSTTALEYPVVADVDNDGSAEIVVVSNTAPNTPRSPTVQVFRDKQERWIQARRIWNQHTYHVTNVEEDGRIPQFETPHWERLNTFRTNAQIRGGEPCAPRPVR
jgi:hypothetical protein